MPDLQDGETVEMQGSGAKPYVLKNTGGVYSCTCPAWRNQSVAIEQRTCKHIRKLRGDDAENARVGASGGSTASPRAAKNSADGEDDSADAGPPLLLAESWDNAADLSGWWMSEKLDGVRAYWDGKQFLSRLGNQYHAPDWFIDGLPDVPLDGELWIGRKKFQRTVSVVRRQDKSDLWKEVRYLVFDAPAAPGGFEERVKFIAETISRLANQTYVRAHEHQLCKDVDCLRKELVRVEALGGEGLMLRQPGSKYHAGRSSTLLKVKSFKDAEAEVIGHQDGAGRHKGRLGALLVRLADGTEFAVGTGFSDREREEPPAIGSTVTFRYQELSEAGVPRFPSYIGVRDDVVLKTQKKAPAKVAKPAPAAPVAPAAPIASSNASAGGSKQRYFEFVDDKSSKFWEVSHAGSELTTRWGKIGAAGQSKSKSFADESAAAAEMAKLIKQKTGEGYAEK